MEEIIAFLVIIIGLTVITFFMMLWSSKEDSNIWEFYSFITNDCNKTSIFLKTHNIKYAIKLKQINNKNIYKIKAKWFLFSSILEENYNTIDECKQEIIRLFKQRINYLNKCINCNKDFVNKSIELDKIKYLNYE